MLVLVVNIHMIIARPRYIIKMRVSRITVEAIYGGSGMVVAVWW